MGQEGAVQNHVCLGLRPLHGLLEHGGRGGQKVHGLADVAVDRGQADVERRGKPGVGVTAAQVGEDQQGLTWRGQAPPAGAQLTPVLGEQPAQEPQARTGKVDRGRVDKHNEAPSRTSDLGRELVYQELGSSVSPTAQLIKQVENSSLSPLNRSQPPFVVEVSQQPVLPENGCIDSSEEAVRGSAA